MAAPSSNKLDCGLFVRYDEASPHVEWYKEKYASVEAWKADEANQAPGKDVMEAFLPWEAEYVEKSQGEMTVPWTIGNLSEAHITAILRSSGTINADTTVKITEKKPLGGNDAGRMGVLSCIFRVSCEYKGGNGPATMIYKTSPLTDDFYGMRGLSKGMHAFEIECNWYNTKFPFVGDALPCPISYFAVCDAEAARYMLLLEDLNARSEGMTPGDQVAGLTDAQLSTAEICFQGAAKLHAKYWNKTKNFNKHLQDWNKTQNFSAPTGSIFCKFWDEPFWPTVFPLMWGATWEPYQKACVEHGITIDADVKEFGDWIGTVLVDHFAFSASCKEKGGFMNATIVHCDFRLDNLFFDYQKDGSTLSVDGKGNPLWCVIDWQLVAECNPGFELSYFISQSVSPDFRHKHEKRLITQYYDKLIEGGVSATEFPFAMLLHHYQVGQAFSFYYSVFAGNGAFSNGERGIELSKCLLYRWVAAFREWNGIAAIKWNIARWKDKPSEPLTVDECLSQLPEAIRAWVNKDGTLIKEVEPASGGYSGEPAPVVDAAKSGGY